MFADPKLNNTTTDFTLQSSSPAIGSGYLSKSSAIDITGTIRQLKPDVGAYQYNVPSMCHGGGVGVATVAESVEFGNMHYYPGSYPPKGSTSTIYNLDAYSSKIKNVFGNAFVTTETGETTVLYNATSAAHNGINGISELAQSKYQLGLIFDNILAGACRVYIYELGDELADPDLSLIHISEPTRPY